MIDPRAPPAPLASSDDEPRSPKWLPLLGAALFIVFGLLWVLTPPMPPPPVGAAAAPAATARAPGGPSAPSLAARPAAPQPGLGARLGLPPADPGR